MGVRQVLATHVPAHARTIVDLGSGDGDGPAAVARLLPSASVTALEASPYMIICGRRQNTDVPNMSWQHGLAEDTKLPSDHADAVTITLVSLPHQSPRAHPPPPKRGQGELLCC